MTLSQKIIELLETNNGAYLSGNQIAVQLGVSRAAVWKVIKKLIEQGYQIDAIRNKGYCLLKHNDVISHPGISKYLQSNPFTFEIHEQVSSTNTLLKTLALDPTAPEGCCLIASSQTDGYGRFTREFYSPRDTGIYLSILLRPTYSASIASKITCASAVALCKTIEQLTSLHPLIKWVNDVYIDDKKVAGILTEATYDMESQSIESIVLGVGINIYEPHHGFPDSIKHTAGAIFDEPKDDCRNLFIATFLNHFWTLYTNLLNPSIILDYRSRNYLKDKQVTIHRRNESIHALVQDIDEQCHLVVKHQDGSLESILSDEVSLHQGGL